jgi:hypothetical protein
MKCFIILVVAGATGIVIKGLEICVEVILGKRSIGSVQKTALLGAS